jgi:hypothetical protein
MRESRFKLAVWLLFLLFLLLIALVVAPSAATTPLEVQATDQPFDPGLNDVPHSIFIPIVLNRAEAGTEQSGPVGPGDPGEPEDPEEGEIPGNPEEPGEPEEQTTGFEIDGNTIWDEVGSGDWETADFPPAIHIQDPHSRGARDRTVFKPNGKFDHPESWKISQGRVGAPQTELTNIMTWFVKKGDLGTNKPSSNWLLLAMERSKTEGTFFLDFEYNQFPWDGSAGGLLRSPGDLSVGFAIHGNPDSVDDDLRIFIIQYYPGEQPVSCSVSAGSSGKPEFVEPGIETCPPFGDQGWYYRFLGTSAELAASGLGEATMNEYAFPAAWDSYDSHGDSRKEIPPFQFAEAAINLDALDIEVTCATWSSVHAKGRSSIQPGSDLKDLAGPIQLSNNCRLEGHKFLDVNGNGLWDGDEPPLADWVIHLTAREVATTDAHGHYEFEGLDDGTYQVRESCPNGWVQTSPGLTDFASCGSEEFQVDINIGNSVVEGLDFGNGRPELTASQTCQGDVFLGDDIRYTVRLTNEGNVDLIDIVIDEPEAGEVAAIDRLRPGQSATQTYSVTATAPGEVSKSVMAKGTYGLAVVRATAAVACKTQVHFLEVNKQAQPALDRQYRWTISKEVDDPGPIVILRGSVWHPTYTVIVGLDEPGFIDRNPRVAGTITVDNPAPMAATLASVEDLMEPGVDIPVTCPALVVPAGGTLVCTYGPVTLPNIDKRLNSATVTLKNNNGQTTDFKDSIMVDFNNAELNHIDNIVDVTDSMAGSLGSVHFSEAPKTITYKTIIGPYDDTCGQERVDNVASYDARDSGATGKATASVEIFVMCTLRLGFEDLSLEGSNDWDYNDLVVDVGIRVTLGGNMEEPDLEAIHLTTKRLVGGPEFSAKVHEFHVAPDVFSCDGNYLKRTYRPDGSVFEEAGKFYNGDDILIFTEAKPIPERVELSIFFDVPPEGCPCNKEILGDPLNNFHGESLFFYPWMKAIKNGGAITVEPGDSRLLAVPDQWQWPDEMQSIWLKYPKVTEGNPPIFVPFWWLP